MTRDELLSEISQEMQEINSRLAELSKEKRRLIDKQAKLIESWNIKVKG